MIDEIIHFFREVKNHRHQDNEPDRQEKGSQVLSDNIDIKAFQHDL